MSSSSRTYTVGWICALPVELQASRTFLEKKYDAAEDGMRQARGDDNTYTLGSIGGHNIVMACLPNGVYGTSSATMVAKDMLRSFPDIRFGLMVGIGGGAPYFSADPLKPHRRDRDVRLGDVVISRPGDGHAGIYQHDFGKNVQDQEFRVTAHLNKPHNTLLTAISVLESEHGEGGNGIHAKVEGALSQRPRMKTAFSRPQSDVLFASGAIHVPDSHGDCGTECFKLAQLQRCQRDIENGVHDISTVHYGLIASGNELLKNAEDRDELARRKGVLCFEMEAAGLMNTGLGCLVIRGICDYCDTHKNDSWHPYASMVAAAYASDLLHTIRPWQVEQESTVDATGIMKQISNIASDIINTKDLAVKFDAGMTREENGRLLEWLSQEKPGEYHSLNLKRYHEGTCKWFLECPEFQQWKETRGQTLFCPGAPGAGKTTLTSCVIEHLNKSFTNTNTRVAMAYVYFSFTRTTTRAPGYDDLLASITKQLARKQADSGLPMNDIKTVYNTRSSEDARPTSQDIENIFSRVTSHFDQVFILLDGLDECDTATREQLLNFFSLQQGLNIFATARFIEDIRAKFQEKFPGHHHVVIQATYADLRAFLDGEINKNPGLGLRDSEIVHSMRELIIDTIANAVGGTFLLARLHFDLIKELNRKSAMKNALFQLQTRGSSQHDKNVALEQAYNATIEQASVILGALAVYEDDMVFNEDAIPSVNAVTLACAGLITYHNGMFMCSHYTVWEYLHSTKAKWFPEDPHTHLAAICCTYFSLDRSSLEKYRKANESFSSGDETDNSSTSMICNDPTSGVSRMEKLVRERRSNHGWDIYANTSWAYHARKASSLPKQLTTWLANKCSSKHYWPLGIMGDAWSPERGRAAYPCTPLEFASLLGHPPTVKEVLLNHGSTERINDGRYKALVCAAAYGHEEIVTLLLAAGADVNMQALIGMDDNMRRHMGISYLFNEFVKRRETWSALGLALVNGRERITKRLLDAGAVITKADLQVTAFWWSSRSRTEEVERMLHLLRDAPLQFNLSDGEMRRRKRTLSEAFAGLRN